MTDPQGIAADIDWKCAALSALTAHLVEEHHSRFRVEIQTLRELLEQVYVAYRQRDFAKLAPLPCLLFLLGHELDRHMRREELTIFPTIEALENSLDRAAESQPANLGVGFLISEAIAEHDSILDRLAEARRITGNYECPFYADQAYRNLFQRLEALDHNLSQHIRLENDSVFSRSLSLVQHHAA